MEGIWSICCSGICHIITGLGLYLDLAGLWRYKNEGTSDYLIITLLGKVKGEAHDRCHLIPCVRVTSSGIDVSHWINQLIELKKNQGFTSGPAISDEYGKVLPTRAIDDMLHEVLFDLFESERDLFPKGIGSKDDLQKMFQAFRSFRRTSDTRALNQKVDKIDIEIVNRWHTIDQAKGSRGSMPMHQHYAQVSQLLEPYLRYTGAM
jgi:hypothetical protein